MTSRCGGCGRKVALGLLFTIPVLPLFTVQSSAFLKTSSSSAFRLQEWLGLAKVDASALWLLFLSFGAATLLVHFDDWARCAQQSRERRRLAQRMPEEGQPISRASSFDGIESPTPLLASYAAPPTSDAEPQQGEEQWEQQQGHTTLQVTASGALADVQPGLWQPLTLEAQAQWRWTDWLRYAVYRCGVEREVCVDKNLKLPDQTQGHLKKLTAVLQPLPTSDIHSPGTILMYCCARWCLCALWRMTSSTPPTWRLRCSSSAAASCCASGATGKTRVAG